MIKFKIMNRVIGAYSSDKEGALLFITAGIHGNEASGVVALEKIFSKLEHFQPRIKGTIIGLRGNMGGLKTKKRYIEEDLNRVWTQKNILLKKADTYEKKEMWEIINTIRLLSKKNHTKQYFLDCHTTSSHTSPFISVQALNDNDEWAHLFPLPIVRGFSDMVNGCIDQYLSRLGMTGFVFEAGQHEDQESIKNQEGLIWMVIEKACALNYNQIPELSEYIKVFQNKIKEQATFTISHRYTLAQEDHFVMKPGFTNFQKIRKGETLARHNNKEVKSRWDAYIFMPLYQSQGEDGFYIIERV